MSQPVRIRLSRAGGFNLQEHSKKVNGLEAVHVARPGPWGNPFIVGKDGDREYCVELYKHMLNGHLSIVNPGGASLASLKAARAHVADNISQLQGKNLACWCALDGKPCHADVLLRIASLACEEVQP